MDVAYTLVEGNGVDALGDYHVRDRSDTRSQERSQCRCLGDGELGQRLTVPTSLGDELTGVGIGSCVMADKPESIIENDSAGRGQRTGDLGTGTARVHRHVSIA
jgi:hypothetical protein